MQWVKGDFVKLAYENNCNGVAFTANAIIKEDKSKPIVVSQGDICERYKLVMGAGAAKRIRDYYVGSDARFGHIIGRMSVISKHLEENPVNKLPFPSDIYPGLQKDYYTAWVPFGEMNLYAVQVKRHYSEDADWALTKQSLERLAERSNLQIGDSEPKRIILNCPMIGAGGWADREDEVKHMVETTLKDTNILVATF